MINSVIHSALHTKAVSSFQNRREWQHWHFIPFNSPWPRRPSRPMTTLQGSDVICTIPMHHSHSFCRPILRADNLLLLDLQVKEEKKKSKKRIKDNISVLYNYFTAYPLQEFLQFSWVPNSPFTKKKQKKYVFAFTTVIGVTCKRCQYVEQHTSCSWK